DTALGRLSLEELLSELLVRVRSILGVDTAAILLREGEELVARVAKGLEEEVEAGVRIPIGRGFAGLVASEKRPIFIEDVDHSQVLNPILLWVSQLRQRTFAPAHAARALDAIERSARMQARLVDDLLDVSRIIGGKLRLDLRPTELAWVIEAAIEAVRPAAAARDIRIE